MDTIHIIILISVIVFPFILIFTLFLLLRAAESKAPKKDDDPYSKIEGDRILDLEVHVVNTDNIVLLFFTIGVFLNISIVGLVKASLDQWQSAGCGPLTGGSLGSGRWARAFHGGCAAGWRAAAWHTRP